jgi:hypothetical protein
MRAIFLIFLLYKCSLGFTQQKIFEIPVRKEDFLSVKGCVIESPRRDGFFVSIINKESIERYMVALDGRKKLLLSQSDLDEAEAGAKYIDEKILKLYRKYEFVNGIIAQKKWIDVLRNKNNGDFFCIQTDLETGKSTITDTIAAYVKDEVVMSYINNTRLLVMTQKSGVNSFIFHSFTPSAKAFTDSVKMGLPNMGRVSPNPFRRQVSSIADLTKGEKILVSPNNLWVPFHVKYRNKAYLQNDRFLITVNATDLSTWVISIDLNNFEYSVQQFNPFEGEKKPETTSNTSLLIDSFLFTSTATRTEMFLATYNIASGKLLNKKKIDKANFDEIRSSEIEKSGDFWSKSNLSEIDYSEFLRKAFNNQLSLTGYKEGDQIYLTFGTTYNRITSATFLGNLVTLGALGFSEVKPPTVVSFNASFQISDLSATQKNLKSLVWDKLVLHLATHYKHISSFEESTLFNMKGSYYLGYFNFINGKYTVFGFDEKIN